MTELSQKAQTTIRNGISADGPSEADRTRVRNKLILHLGAGALVAGAASVANSAGAAAGKGGAMAMTTKLAIAAVIAGAVGVGTAVVTWKHLSGDKRVAQVPAKQAAEPRADAIKWEPRQTPTSAAKDEQNADKIAADAIAAPAPPATAVHLYRRVTSFKSRVALEEELKLLQAAQLALRQGDAESALRALEDHAVKFPHGVLRQEREAARAVALCGLGRLAQGRQIAGRFLADSPRSPLSARIRKSCGLSEQ